MVKQVKHTENYVGTFTQNAHDAQCQACYDNNSDLLRRIKSVELSHGEWNHYEESQELTQEWFQRKNMEYIPSLKDTCENGCIVIHKSFWICKPHSEEDGYDFDGDVEAWNASKTMAQTPLGTSEVIHTETLN